MANLYLGSSNEKNVMVGGHHTTTLGRVRTTIGAKCLTHPFEEGRIYLGSRFQKIQSFVARRTCEAMRLRSRGPRRREKGMALLGWLSPFCPFSTHKPSLHRMKMFIFIDDLHPTPTITLALAKSLERPS